MKLPMLVLPLYNQWRRHKCAAGDLYEDAVIQLLQEKISCKSKVSQIDVIICKKKICKLKAVISSFGRSRPVWALGHCRTSPPCFLAECHVRWL